MIALLRQRLVGSILPGYCMPRVTGSSCTATAQRTLRRATSLPVALALAFLALFAVATPAAAQCTANCTTATYCGGCATTDTQIVRYNYPNALFGQTIQNSPPNVPDDFQSIFIPKFNSSLGTLQRVQLRFRSIFHNETIHVRNEGGSSCFTGPDSNNQVQVQRTIRVDYPDGLVCELNNLSPGAPSAITLGLTNQTLLANDNCDEWPFDLLDQPGVPPGSASCPTWPFCNGQDPGGFTDQEKLDRHERTSTVGSLCTVAPSDIAQNHLDEIGKRRGPTTWTFPCQEIIGAALSGWQSVGGAGTRTLRFRHTPRLVSPDLKNCTKIDVQTRALASFEVEVSYTYCANRPPVANNDSAQICTGADSNVAIDILANDYDLDSCNNPEVNGLVCSTVTIVNPPPSGQGTAVVSNCTGNQPCPSCRIVYTPPSPTYVGTTSFTYRVSDGEGRTSNLATVTVTVCRPTTQNDTLQVCRNTSCSVNVLANDTVQSYCSAIVPSSVEIVTPPTRGTVSAVVNGLITYQPESGYVGTDSFTYRVRDLQGCYSAPTTVNVTVCSPPSLIRDNACFCPGTNRLINVLANDTAGSCGPIVASTLAISSPPASGSGVSAVVEAGQIRVTVADGAPTGQVTFNYSAAYTVCGQSCASTGEVCVFVQAAPSALDDSAFIDPTIQTSVLIPVKNNDAASTGCTLGTPTLVAGSITPAGSGTVVWVPADNAFRFTPTPPATMPGQVSFQYEICQTCPAVPGCNIQCTETCCRRARVTVNRVCPTFNRLQPASLLLYPKYDTRPGRVSLLTITNTNGNQGGDVDVAFYYVDATSDCQKTGREHRLTPNDTLTVVASTQVPSNAYGYVYAYATSGTDTPVNPFGEPIVFNHLIGQVLILDGAAAADWSVSSVNFKGIGAERSPNDDDNDGIRDLNFEFSSDPLPEYEKAPAELRIPRFIGQQPIDETSVILIALSGGQAFSTTVRVDGYNDNEQPFGSTYEFSCWDQPRLTTLFPAAQEAHMRGASDDPQEIIGATHREAGWFRIQGDSASATPGPEVITNPAIYAVLVEDIAGFAAADLPYEYCQRHGDLLPKGPLGDGPNPSANDNQ